jgi:hypothetical protein
MKKPQEVGESCGSDHGSGKTVDDEGSESCSSSSFKGKMLLRIPFGRRERNGGMEKCRNVLIPSVAARVSWLSFIRGFKKMSTFGQAFCG